ncbi:MAG: ACT domain-containing protein [Anaerolineales bacterium]|nr:ACT domain-containing protein [Anaerolineales bacterium]
MKSLKFFVLEGTFAIHQLKPGAAIPRQVFSSPFYAIAKSENELSIVVAEQIELESERSQPGWSALRVDGSLDFGESGILAGISATLAKAGIPIFAVSTFATDYILLKSELLQQAKAALTEAGHKFERTATKKEEQPASWAVSAYRDVLEKQIPAIRSLLTEKIGPSTLATLRGKNTIGLAVGSAYEFLPAGVRMIVPRQIFVDFVSENLDRILQQDAQKETQPAKEPKRAKPEPRK